MVDESLYNSIYNLLKNSIQLLNDPINYFVESKKRLENSIPFYRKVDPTDSEKIKEYIFIKKYVKQLICGLDQSLKKEFDECICLIENNQKINDQLTHGAIIVGPAVNEVNPKTLLMYTVEIMITNYVLTGKIDDSKLCLLYRDMMDFFYNDHIEIITFTPLHGFKSNTLELIQLTENISIRKISLEEKMNLYSKNISNEVFPYETKWVIEHKTSVSKDFQKNPRIDSHLKDNSFAAIITTLRLFQFGSFGTNTYVRHIPLNVPVYPISTTNLKINGFESTEHGDYCFDDKLLESYREFWQKYGPLLMEILDFRIEENDKRIQIKNALNRFNFSYERDQGLDTIIDYVIALESLLSKPDDPKDSLTYRLSLRASKLRGKNLSERKKIFGEFSDIYGIRSKIVHGSIEEFHYVRPKSKIQKYGIDKIHKLTSDIIIEYLDLMMENSELTHIEIIDKLDFEYPIDGKQQE